MSESIENEPMKRIPKKKKEKFIPLFYNMHLSYPAAEEQLKPAIRQFLFKWLHESTTLASLNLIGSDLYKAIIKTYPYIDENEDDEDGT